MLDNKKSNLSALGIGVVTILCALNVIDESTRDLLFGLFTSSAVYGLRDAIKKK